MRLSHERVVMIQRVIEQCILPEDGTKDGVCIKCYRQVESVIQLLNQKGIPENSNYRIGEKSTHINVDTIEQKHRKDCRDLLVRVYLHQKKSVFFQELQQISYHSNPCNLQHLMELYRQQPQDSL